MLSLRSGLFLLTCSVASSRLAADVPVRPIAGLRASASEELARGAAVCVRGVVTWSDSEGQFTVQDDSAGIFINTVEARSRKLWIPSGIAPSLIQIGRVVTVVGVLDRGGYAPVILPRSVELGPVRPLPAARPMESASFFSGADAAQRVEVRGVPIGYEQLARGSILRMTAGPAIFTIEISDAALRDVRSLVDAEVTIDGVVGSGFNTRSELTNVRVLVGRSEDVRVDKPAPPPFSAPQVTLDRLLPFSAQPALPHRLQVAGVVTFAAPGGFYYLQDGNSAVRVDGRSAEPIAAGDRVQASGFVDMTRHVGELLEAQVRKVGVGMVPEPIEIAPAAVLALNLRAVDTGQAARPHDYDGHLIRFRGRLLSTQSVPEGGAVQRTLLLETPGLTLSAIMPAGADAAGAAILPGSELEITGIVQLEYARMAQTRPYFRPTRLEVLLRGPADVVVMHGPSWWTAQRLWGVIIGSALALGSALLWVSQLRRQIRRKTQELAAEMHARKDAAIEFQAALRERNRLAANLHDTLLQTMGGLGFQIQACEAEMAAPNPDGAPNVHLEVAHKMLDHAVAELRDSVWALRSLPLHGLALPEALQNLADRAGAGHKAQIVVRTSGELKQIPNFVAGNLLLATQEAVHNALKHGSPQRVVIDARADIKPGWIVLTVTDNGAGFTVGQQAGANQGHFGLAGTRERIDRLAGKFHLQSTPGQGTVVRLEVPLRSYDEGLE